MIRCVLLSFFLAMMQCDNRVRNKEIHNVKCSFFFSVSVNFSHSFFSTLFAWLIKIFFLSSGSVVVAVVIVAAVSEWLVLCRRSMGFWLCCWLNFWSMPKISEVKLVGTGLYLTLSYIVQSTSHMSSLCSGIHVFGCCSSILVS